MAKKSATTKTVETLRHEEARRKNIPTAEFQPMLRRDQEVPRRVKYPRNTDLDPQLVWRGKDEQDWADLVVPAPPLYIQEKVHPKALIDDLLRETRERAHEAGEMTPDLFSDFNGIPKGVDKTEFYQHDQNWANRMILGDSLQVMGSLAEREGLRGRVQCIYFDPPYGIKFNSNFQWSTTSRDVRDGKAEHITREPEQVKAFRDTWRDGIHSYLTYLRDRLTVARDLLSESGSIFVQIGDENVHHVRSVLEEVFGGSNFLVTFIVKKKGGTTPTDPVNDYILWACKDASSVKVRLTYERRKIPGLGSKFTTLILPDGSRRSISKLNEEEIASLCEQGAKYGRVDWPLISQDPSARSRDFEWEGKSFPCATGGHWRYDPDTQMRRLAIAGRLNLEARRVSGIVLWEDWPYESRSNLWDDTGAQQDLIYVVQTPTKVVERCILTASDPGDLVLDPTCGSGTTAFVAEQWGRRWITVDSSRVALALARARIMGAKYPYFLLADSREGQLKEAEVTRSAPSSRPTSGDVRQGFVYERIPRVSLKSIADNTEIDVIRGRWRSRLDAMRNKLNEWLGTDWEESAIPRDISEVIGQEGKFQKAVFSVSPSSIRRLHAEWWEAHMALRQEIDASIASKAEVEYLYDKPYEDSRRVRVAGPFTVESLSPHRTLGMDENDELIDDVRDQGARYELRQSFPQMILENLRVAGVQQAHKEDRITFTSLIAWPGRLICGEGRYLEGDIERRAGIFIGPEFGTVQRADLVEAAREAADGAFDVLIACAFNYEAHTTDFAQLGRIRVLKARMNADLHMAEDLKNTGKGNLFVIFGEPDIEVIHEKDEKLRVKVKGVDVFKPQTGEVVSNGPDEIACWFIDTDYNEESFFVRHAYFLGANDPYNALKTTLKAEIDVDAWESLQSDTSRPFARPKSGRIAVKVINHLGDEVMKIFRVR